MGTQSTSFEDRLSRLHDTTGQIHVSNKVSETPVGTPAVEPPEKGYDRSTLMFSALMITSFLGVCILGVMVFDLTISVNALLDSTPQ